MKGYEYYFEEIQQRQEIDPFVVIAAERRPQIFHGCQYYTKEIPKREWRYCLFKIQKTAFSISWLQTLQRKESENKRKTLIVSCCLLAVMASEKPPQIIHGRKYYTNEIQKRKWKYCLLRDSENGLMYFLVTSITQKRK